MTDTTRIAANLPNTPAIDPTLLQGSNPRNTPAAGVPTSGPTFAELLRTRQGLADDTGAPSDVRFSAHAQTRMVSRNINLNDGEMDRLSNAVQKAAGKGSKDALVLMDNLAMVVSVKNRTVVTVVDKDSLKQNVFTNIDSAVIA